MNRQTAIVLATALALGACGGSSGSSKSKTTAGSTSGAASQSGGASVTSGPVHATLTAPNHAPTVNKPWHYSIMVTDATGHPLSGTVDVEFVFGGQVVGRATPPTDPVKDGRWQDNLKFPPTATGVPLTFRLVVHTKLGSATLDWPVTARS